MCDDENAEWNLCALNLLFLSLHHHTRNDGEKIMKIIPV